MVSVELFSDSKVDNAGNMGNFGSLTEQNSYFSGLTKKVITGVRMNNLGDPIEVQVPWTSVLGYSYGRFQINAKWFYFSIDDIVPINDSKTSIRYNLDVWETCRHQYTVTLGRGKVSRSGRSLPMRNPRPFTPMWTRTSTIQRLSIENPLGIAFVRDSENNENYVYVCQDRNKGIGPFVDGSWLTMLGINSLNDVMGAWLSPFSVDVTNWESLTGTEIVGYRKAADGLNWIQYGVPLDATAVMDQADCIGMTDMRGNLVWTSDLGGGTETYLYCYLNVSPSTCNWRCVLDAPDLVHPQGTPERTFTIPCEPVYYFSDAFQEYNVRQREFDMEQRAINRDSQLVSGLSGVGSSAVGGAVAGALLGPAGAVAGAALGAVGGIVGSIASYAIQPTFDNRTQRATDAFYKRQADTLVLSGDGLLNILTGLTGCDLVNVETDAGTVTQYNDAVSTAGFFYSDLEVEDMEDFVVDGSLTADVQVLGPIPDAWKAQVQQRIARGVRFV